MNIRFGVLEKVFQKFVKLQNHRRCSTFLPEKVYKLFTPLLFAEAVVPRCYVKKVLLEISQNSQTKVCNFIKKESLAQVFSCEFCEISKNTFFTEHRWLLLFLSQIEITCKLLTEITVLKTINNKVSKFTLFFPSSTAIH